VNYQLNFKTSIFIVTITVLVAAIGSYLFFTQQPSLKGTNQLVVGTTAGYAPFVSINPQGEYEGIDIDIAHALAKQMGKTLVLKDLGSMSSLFMALDQGGIDAIIWGLSITQDRLKKVTMIHYLGETTNSYPLLFWKNVPAGITSLTDMQDRTICVEPASSQDSFLSNYSSIIKLPVEKIDDALLNIQYGKADAALVEPAIAKKFKAKYPEIQIVDLPLAQKDLVQGIGIAVKPNNTKLIKELEDAVAVLRSIGLITQLEQTWNLG
jgi:arginine/lysine/histidine transporter system substrate-binding protein